MQYKNIKALKQADATLKPWLALRDSDKPHKGFLRLIRKALNIPVAILAKKLKVSQQNVFNLERAECRQNITLKKLNEIAMAMDCMLIYAIVPQKGTLSSFVDSVAQKKAHHLLKKTEHTMELEGQANKLFKETKGLLKERVKDGSLKNIWNHE
ncbi:MAG: hypothetical protein A2Y14_03190 [Verrucomicrobia bacterium GWF2_51_19]|nr:MAG: hypothetical protein A2Y14_03190 [Verrucomicrobia bacterium GWF2_51_19]HCJ12371.1 hypothetical protein [Opitutae bacterium]